MGLLAFLLRWKVRVGGHDSRKPFPQRHDPPCLFPLRCSPRSSDRKLAMNILGVVIGAGGFSKKTARTSETFVWAAAGLGRICGAGSRRKFTVKGWKRSRPTKVPRTELPCWQGSGSASGKQWTKRAQKPSVSRRVSSRIKRTSRS